MLRSARPTVVRRAVVLTVVLLAWGCTAAVLPGAWTGPARAVVTAPAPTIDSPVEGATVSGDIELSAHSSSAYVRFSTTWNDWPVKVVAGVATTSVSTLGLDGLNAITATACEAADTCTGGQSAVDVVFDNPAPTITSPADGATYWPWDTPTFSVMSAGAVQFSVNGADVLADDTAPYSMTLDLSGLVGDVTISARGCSDGFGVCHGKSVSRTIHVTDVAPQNLNADAAAFSPDGDGVLDTLNVTFTLTTTADVSYRWEGPLASYGPVAVGRLGPGEHTVVVDGMANGSPVPDGRKKLWFVTSPVAAPDHLTAAGLAVTIDRQAPKPVHVSLISGQFYPYPDGYRDGARLQLHAVDRGTLLSKVTLEMLDPAGHVVFTRAWSGNRSNRRFTWNGRSTRGSLVAAGTYAVRLTAWDGAGHSSSDTMQLVVHDEMAAKRTLRYRVPADRAWDWFVGSCSSRAKEPRWKGGVRLLSDTKCSSKPYHNDRHVVAAAYRVHVPANRILSWGTAAVEVYGGALSQNAYAGLSMWSGKQRAYGRPHWLSSPTGVHRFSVFQPAGSVGEGRLYWEIFTNRGCRYALRETRIRIPVVQLVHPPA